MTWFVISLALSVVSGVALAPYLVLFKPWRVKPLAHWLYDRSSLYRRWILRWFFIRPTRKTAAAMVALVPAMKRATLAMEKFGDTLRKIGPIEEPTS